MIPYNPINTLFSIGPFEVRAWGLLVAIGILAGLIFAIREARRKNLDVDKVYSIVLYSLIFGLIGGRLGYALTVESLSLSEMFRLWHGGLIWSGALIGGLIGFYLVIAKDNSKLKYLDVFAIALALGHATGRIGCYLAGLHLGKASNIPWAINLGGQLRHPVSGYEFIAEFILFFILFSQRKKKLFDGALFGFYIMGYSVLRFSLDFLRTDPSYFGLTIAQWFSMALFIVFGGILLNNLKNE